MGTVNMAHSVLVSSFSGQSFATVAQGLHERGLAACAGADGKTVTSATEAEATPIPTIFLAAAGIDAPLIRSFMAAHATTGATSYPARKLRDTWLPRVQALFDRGPIRS